MWTTTHAAAAADNRTPKIEPLTCAIGAEVKNVNLGVAARDPGLMAEIRALLLQYKVLFFRDQEFTRAEHVAFARHFGELEDHPVAGSDPDHPGLVRIYKSPEAPNDRYENAWHCDAIDKRLALKAQYPDAEHPVVRTHPETSEKILFVNGFTTHFTNFHKPDNVRYGQDFAPGAAQLLQYLISQAQIPEYQVRFRWQPNSVAFWDNRCTQHYAVMDYPPCHR